QHFKDNFFIPNLVGGVLLGFIWQFIFTNAFKALSVNLGQNWLNGWLSDETTGFWGLVILFTWQMSGYIMLVYISFLNAIPKNSLEASLLDGASELQTFFNVKLPQLAPAFTISLFLT